MPSIETLVWVLTGAVTLISILGGTIWKLLRDEAKDQAEQIKKKADSDRLHEAEARWTSEIKSVKENGEKLVNKLEARHERDLDQMASRLSDQIKNSEVNILTQMRLMLSILKPEKD